MSRKPILIVEDDETIRENLKDLLESEGYQVETAANGREGLHRIRGLGGRCLVLLDLQMPVMTGEELLDALREESDGQVAAAPIIIVTARAEPVEHQVCACLRKPLELDELFSVVEKWSA